ncbi:MAG: WG repeat-containing protein [Alistipes sp.]|nr:WG repeat-containing protein [Alistipes sp.]
MNICSTSQFLCSLKYPQSRLRTLHNIICYPETFLCNKHIAVLEGSLDGDEYLFYAPITIKGTDMVREAVTCAKETNFCDISIVEDEILYSGIGTGSCSLVMDPMLQGIRLNEAIYTLSKSNLISGLEEFKSRLKQLDISHSNINLNNILVDSNYHWHSICNYNLHYGFGGDDEGFMAIERSINSLGIPDEPTAKSLEQLRLHSITTDGEGNIIYPIVESCRRFTSRNGVGFKDRNDNVIIADEYLWATDFSSNRAVVQLKNSKMGIIDRKGRYIIQPLYSSVVYNPTDGISVVHNGELQARFNYLGEQIEEWHK